MNQQCNPIYEGIKYLNGVGVKKDYKKANEIFKGLIAKGDNNAGEWVALVNMHISLQIFRQSLERNLEQGNSLNGGKEHSSDHGKVGTVQYAEFIRAKILQVVSK